MKKALFIGRFQPFHKGHLHAIKYILANFQEIIIVIGSSNKRDTFENPFSFEERRDMIKKSGVWCKIIRVKDVKDDKKWVKSIIEMSKFDVVITGNDWVKRCFLNSEYRIIKPDFLEPEKYDASRIREMMAKDDENWKKLVPKGTLEVLEKINIKERLKI
ncbi:MAG: nicotinamide-nucleotide adenylyltransferase [Promethearchaeota archaeon]